MVCKCRLWRRKAVPGFQNIIGNTKNVHSRLWNQPWFFPLLRYFNSQPIRSSIRMQCSFYFVTLAEPYLATGRGLWEATPLDLLSQTNQVCGWIYFFKLSYFDCSDHFHGREIGWSTVCANSKLKEAKKPLLKLACICSIWKVHSNLQRVTGPSVV